MAIDHVNIVGHEAARLAAVGQQGPLDALVPGCPGWDLNRLVGHVGRVHRWAAACIRAGGEADGSTLERPPRDNSVVGWFEAGIRPLLDTLASAPDPGVWNFVGAPDPDGLFWPRRMAIETSIHRWDAEDAIWGEGETSPVDAAVAAEGIEESLRYLAPRALAGRDDIDIGGSVHVHSTDAPGEWMIYTEGGGYRVESEHGKGAVAVRGPASSLLLLLYRRVAPREATTEVLGDAAVLDRWLALGA